MIDDGLLRRRLLFQYCPIAPDEDIYVYLSDMNNMFNSKSIKSNIYIDGQVQNMQDAFYNSNIQGSETYPLSIYFNESSLSAPRVANGIFQNATGQYFNIYFSNNMNFTEESFLFNNEVSNIGEINFGENAYFTNYAQVNLHTFNGLKYFNAKLNFSNNTNYLKSSNIIHNCPNFNSDIFIGDNSNIYNIIYGSISEYYDKTITIGNNVTIRGSVLIPNSYHINPNIIIGDDCNINNLFYAPESAYQYFNGKISFGNNIYLNNCHVWNIRKYYNGKFSFGDNTFFCVGNREGSFLRDFENFNQNIVIEANSYIDEYFLENCENFNSYITLRPGVKFVNGLLNHCSNFNQRISIPAGCEVNKLIRSCQNFNSPILFYEGIEKLSNIVVSCPNFNQPIYLPTGIKNCSNFIQSSTYNQFITLYPTIEDCYGMFNGCTNFNTAPLIMEGIQNVNGLFSNLSNFNKKVDFPSTIKNVANCFQGSENFNQPVKLYKATDCNYLFGNLMNFNSPIYFDYVPERTAAWMLGATSSYSKLYEDYCCELDFNCDYLVNSHHCFYQLTNFNSNINTKLKGDCSFMFKDCRKFSQILDFSCVTNAVRMMEGCSSYGKGFPEYDEQGYFKEYKFDFSNCNIFSFAFHFMSFLGNAHCNFIMNKEFRDVDIDYMTNGLNIYRNYLNIYGANNCYKAFYECHFKNLIVDCGRSNAPIFDFAFDHAAGDRLYINCGFPYDASYNKINLSSAFPGSSINHIYINIGDSITRTDFNHAFSSCYSLSEQNLHFTGAKINSKNGNYFMMFNDCRNLYDLKTLLDEIFSDNSNIYASDSMFRNSYIQKYGYQPLELYGVGNEVFSSCNKFNCSQIIINHYCNMITGDNSLSKDVFNDCSFLNNFKILNCDFEKLSANFIGSRVGYNTVEQMSISGYSDYPINNSHILDIYIKRGSNLHSHMITDPIATLNNAFIVYGGGKVNYYELTNDYIDYHIDPLPESINAAKNHGYTFHFYD